MPWICKCGQENTTAFCTQCGSPMPENKPESDKRSWVCECGTINENDFCTSCGKKKQDSNEAKDRSAISSPKTKKKNKKSKKNSLIILAIISMILSMAVGVYKANFTQDNKNAKTNEIVTTAKTDVPKNNVDAKENNKKIGKEWVADKDTGVYVFYADHKDNEKISWLGESVEYNGARYANGSGRIVYYKEGKMDKIDYGEYVKGKKNDKIMRVYSDGKIEVGLWNNGEEVKNTDIGNLYNAGGAQGSFMLYHVAISDKFYTAAFNMLSTERKKKMGSYEKFVKGFTTTITSYVADTSDVKYNGDRCSFAYTLQAVDAYKDNKKQIRIFKGNVQMIWENGQWKINDAFSKKVEERIE